MTTVVVSLSDRDVLASFLAGQLDSACSRIELHAFPDGEIRLRIEPDDVEKTVLVVASLDRPNPKLIPLLFLSRTLRDYGAERVVLIAPYLAYMRQDHRFQEGEGISARYFAELISSYFDGLLTVDAHLHRIRALDEVYTIPALNVAAAPAVAEWIADNVDQPLLVGPDSESEQWVADVATRSDLPYVILEKHRRGDRDVQVSIPDTEQWRNNTPVLVDDIISTGASMAETIRHLKRAAMKPPVCIGVHGLFAGDAEQALVNAGAGRIVSSNTVSHPTNEIDVGPAVHEAVGRLLQYLA